MTNLNEELTYCMYYPQKTTKLRFNICIKICAWGIFKVKVSPFIFKLQITNNLDKLLKTCNLLGVFLTNPLVCRQLLLSKKSSDQLLCVLR